MEDNITVTQAQHRMSYKAVIEEQIKKLQEVQEKTDDSCVDEKIALAKAIASLVIDSASLR
jgi:hypothetical protein